MVSRSWLVAALAAGSVAACVSCASPDPDLRALSPAERRVLFHRTMENLDAVCRPLGSDALSGFCVEQARLVASLPECDTACRDLVQPILFPATR
jgi:hypothetical protein